MRLRRKYTYDPFGGTSVHDIVGSSTNPFQFAGRELDDETGLYYNRKRYYHPGLGRFLSPDPLLHAGRRDARLAGNDYEYAADDPLRFVDPTGLLNFLFGAGGSATAPTGAELSGGFVFNPESGRGGDSFNGRKTYIQTSPIDE